MALSLTDIRYHDITFGTLKSDAGDPLTINGRLFELPARCDYWLGTYLATRHTGDERKFTLVIPKSIAATRLTAIDIMKGAAFARIQECCTQAATPLSPIGPFFSQEGWVLT